MKVNRRTFYSVFLAICAATLVVVFVLDRQHQEQESYSQIEDGLWMGGLAASPPPGTKAVLNLCEHEDPYQCATHSWEPIRDAAPAPSLDWLRQRVEFVDQQRRDGKSIYVHCFAGVSRSAMVVTAYLMARNQWSRDQALAFVRSKRPIVRPNSAFMQLLSEWERDLKARPPS